MLAYPPAPPPSLMHMQVPFDRNDSGELALCLEASHNRARIIHWRDATGKAITTSVQAAAALHPNISLRTGTTAVDLALAERASAAAGSVRTRGTQCVGAHVMVKVRNLTGCV